MSRVPPHIESISFVPSGSNFDMVIKWRVAGADDVIPGDEPDKFRVIDDVKHTDVFLPADKTEFTIKDIPPGAIVTVSVCCVWLRGEDTIDQEECRVDREQAPAGPPPPPPPPPPSSRPTPVITEVTAHHATIQQPNRIVLRWRAARSYEWYFVRVKRIDVATGGESQIELNFNQSFGLFTWAPAVPGARYDFKVAGCDESDIGTTKHCSDFTEPIEVQAALKTRSLRAFLGGSDASRGVRLLLTRVPPLPPVRSLRALML